MKITNWKNIKPVCQVKNLADEWATARLCDCEGGIVGKRLVGIELNPGPQVERADGLQPAAGIGSDVWKKRRLYREQGLKVAEAARMVRETIGSERAERNYNLAMLCRSRELSMERAGSIALTYIVRGFPSALWVSASAQLFSREHRWMLDAERWMEPSLSNQLHRATALLGMRRSISTDFLTGKHVDLAAAGRCYGLVEFAESCFTTETGYDPVQYREEYQRIREATAGRLVGVEPNPGPRVIGGRQKIDPDGPGPMAAVPLDPVELPISAEVIKLQTALAQSTIDLPKLLMLASELAASSNERKLPPKMLTSIMSALGGELGSGSIPGGQLVQAVAPLLTPSALPPGHTQLGQAAGWANAKTFDAFRNYQATVDRLKSGSGAMPLFGQALQNFLNMVSPLASDEDRSVAWSEKIGDWLQDHATQLLALVTGEEDDAAPVKIGTVKEIAAEAGGQPLDTTKNYNPMAVVPMGVGGTGGFHVPPSAATHSMTRQLTADRVPERQEVQTALVAAGVKPNPGPQLSWEMFSPVGGRVYRATEEGWRPAVGEIQTVEDLNLLCGAATQKVIISGERVRVLFALELTDDGRKSVCAFISDVVRRGWSRSVQNLAIWDYVMCAWGVVLPEAADSSDWASIDVGKEGLKRDRAVRVAANAGPRAQQPARETQRGVGPAEEAAAAEKHSDAAQALLKRVTNWSALFRILVRAKAPRAFSAVLADRIQSSAAPEDPVDRVFRDCCLLVARGLPPADLHYKQNLIQALTRAAIGLSCAAEMPGWFGSVFPSSDALGTVTDSDLYMRLVALSPVRSETAKVHTSGERDALSKCGDVEKLPGPWTVHGSWVRDLLEDGDVEGNPGPKEMIVTGSPDPRLQQYSVELVTQRIPTTLEEVLSAPTSNKLMLNKATPMPILSDPVTVLAGATGAGSQWSQTLATGGVVPTSFVASTINADGTNGPVRAVVPTESFASTLEGFGRNNTTGVWEAIPMAFFSATRGTPVMQSGLELLSTPLADELASMTNYNANNIGETGFPLSAYQQLLRGGTSGLVIDGPLLRLACLFLTAVILGIGTPYSVTPVAISGLGLSVVNSSNRTIVTFVNGVKVEDIGIADTIQGVTGAVRWFPLSTDRLPGELAFHVHPATVPRGEEGSMLYITAEVANDPVLMALFIMSLSEWPFCGWFADCDIGFTDNAAAVRPSLATYSVGSDFVSPNPTRVHLPGSKRWHVMLPSKAANLVAPVTQVNANAAADTLPTFGSQTMGTYLAGTSLNISFVGAPQIYGLSQYLRTFYYDFTPNKVLSLLSLWQRYGIPAMDAWDAAIEAVTFLCGRLRPMVLCQPEPSAGTTFNAAAHPTVILGNVTGLSVIDMENSTNDVVTTDPRPWNMPTAWACVPDFVGINEFGTSNPTHRGDFWFGSEQVKPYNMIMVGLARPSSAVKKNPDAVVAPWSQLPNGDLWLNLLLRRWAAVYQLLFSKWGYSITELGLGADGVHPRPVVNELVAGLWSAGVLDGEILAPRWWQTLENLHNGMCGAMVSNHPLVRPGPWRLVKRTSDNFKSSLHCSELFGTQGNVRLADDGIIAPCTLPEPLFLTVAVNCPQFVSPFPPVDQYTSKPAFDWVGTFSPVRFNDAVELRGLLTKERSLPPDILGPTQVVALNDMNGYHARLAMQIANYFPVGDDAGTLAPRALNGRATTVLLRPWLCMSPKLCFLDYAMTTAALNSSIVVEFCSFLNRWSLYWATFCVTNSTRYPMVDVSAYSTWAPIFFGRIRLGSRVWRSSEAYMMSGGIIAPPEATSFEGFMAGPSKSGALTASKNDSLSPSVQQ
jgi:hypothetical protein